MKKNTPTARALADRRPAGLGSLQKIQLGFEIGVLAGFLVVLIYFERPKADAITVRREVKAQTFTGPAHTNAPTKRTGGAWLGLRSSVPAQVRVEPGAAGASSARGAAGAAWGPVAKTVAAPLPKGAIGGRHIPLGQAATLQVDPTTVNQRRVLFNPDAGFSIAAGVPDHLRFHQEDVD